MKFKKKEIFINGLIYGFVVSTTKAEMLNNAKVIRAGKEVNICSRIYIF